MMRPLLTINFTPAQLREIRKLILDQGGDGAMLGVEFTNDETGEVTTVEQPLPLATIEQLLAAIDAADRHARN